MPSWVINYRPPDPYVELDGERKPLSEYPDLRIVRTNRSTDEEIPNLREVSTGWITRAERSTSGIWVEKQEPLNNVRITGLYPIPVVVTGILSTASLKPMSPPAPQPAPVQPAPSCPGCHQSLPEGSREVSGVRVCPDCLKAEHAPCVGDEHAANCFCPAEPEPASPETKDWFDVMDALDR